MPREGKRAVVLQHAAFEGPARIADRLAAHGCEGDPVPARLEPTDLLVVMGGPMGVADRANPATAFLQAEIDLLRTRVEQDAPVLGVCLGAQLLAHGAGARVYPMTSGDGSRVREVGWGPIQLHVATAGGVLAGLPPESHVLHWHGDTFDLTSGATLLAPSARCPHQGFRLKRRLFGLQFHCEVDREHVEAFLRADGDFIRRANGPEGVEALRHDTQRHVGEARRVGDRLLDNILEAMLAD